MKQCGQLALLAGNGRHPCIRGMRVTVGTIVGLVAAGRTTEEILREYCEYPII